jgi:hypothetical protein
MPLLKITNWMSGRHGEKGARLTLALPFQAVPFSTALHTSGGVLRTWTSSKLGIPFERIPFVPSVESCFHDAVAATPMWDIKNCKYTFHIPFHSTRYVMLHTPPRRLNK